MGLRHIAEVVNLKHQQPLKEPNQDSHSTFFIAKQDFKSLLKGLEVEKGGFLIKTDEDFYSLCFASGIDITTFHRCIIPAEIIDSFNIEENKWYTLSDTNLSSIKNFFSSQEYISITDIILFSIEKNKTFLFLIKSQKDIYRNSFNLINADQILRQYLSKYDKYKLIIGTVRPAYPSQHGMDTIILKIESALNFNNQAHLVSISFKNIFPDVIKLQSDLDSLSLYYSMVNKIYNLIGKSNIAILGMDNSIYICIFSAQSIPMELYTKKILDNLYTIYGEELCSKLIVEYTGASKNINKIKDFFKAGINDKTI